jgi:hypothetical protein
MPLCGANQANPTRLRNRPFISTYALALALEQARDTSTEPSTCGPNVGMAYRMRGQTGAKISLLEN